MDITLQLCTSKGLASHIIRWFTWSDYSHVDIVMPDGTLLGARLDGVKIRPANYEKFTATKRFIARNCPQAVMDFAMAQIGKPYDKTGIVNFGFHRQWKDEDSWFCSELVAASFEKGGKPLVRVPDDDRVTPRDLTLSLVLEEI